MTNTQLIRTGMQIEGGWSVDSNIFVNDGFNIQEEPFDNTLLFSAINHITGKSISISYINSDIGYSFDCCTLSRYLGAWHYDENKNIYQTLKTDCHVDNMSELLQHYLNPLQKNLIPLKISSWQVNYNNWTDDENLHDDVELLFSATRGKLFIDVTYYKNTDKPYYIYMGLSKQEYTELTYTTNKPTIKYKEIYLEKKTDAVSIVNNFLTGLESYLSKI